MKVLMTTDSVDGVWTYSMELARALGARGVQVVLGCLGPAPDAAQRAEAQANGIPLHVREGKLEWMSDPWDDLARSGRWLLDLEREAGADVVHLNGYAHAGLPWGCPVVVAAHSCVLSWHDAVRGEPAGPQWSRYRQEVARGLRHADAVVAPTQAMLDAMALHYGQLEPARVIYNGRGREALLPGEKEPIVMSAGRLWDPAKNIAALDQIAPKLPWSVYVAGQVDSPWGDHQPLRHVIPLGVLTPAALGKWLAKASIYAAPARYEPFGMSILEAALCGCALVLGDIPSLREIWGDTALYVSPDDPESLVNVIRVLAVDELRRRQLADAAHRRALQLTPQRMAAQYARLYEELKGAAITSESAVVPLASERIAAVPRSNGALTIAMFYHSLVSDWNHGNAHFLRGVVSELQERGHTVRVFEPRNGWSAQNQIDNGGPDALCEFRSAYPSLVSTEYDLDSLDLHEALHDADLVIVHESNDPRLVARIGEHRARVGKYRLLFHDTHHRAVSNPQEMMRYDLSSYDGVLAFGQALRDLYLRSGRTHAAWVWHEAADVRVFRPIAGERKDGDVVWIGNWGDNERSAELREFLIEPVVTLKLRARVYGVRYPLAALQMLAEAGIEFGGWLPNFRVPEVFSRFRVTVHIPRWPYVRELRGVPTIRPFEALACGIPMVSAPWDDTEGLFAAGRDFLLARDKSEMTQCLQTLIEDPEYAHKVSLHGRNTILQRHTTAHRVGELLGICRQLGLAAAGAGRGVGIHG